MLKMVLITELNPHGSSIHCKPPYGISMAVTRTYTSLPKPLGEAEGTRLRHKSYQPGFPAVIPERLAIPVKLPPNTTPGAIRWQDKKTKPFSNITPLTKLPRVTNTRPVRVEVWPSSRHNILNIVQIARQQSPSTPASSLLWSRCSKQLESWVQDSS